ncbi:MAG: bifunctional 5,10-methylenetetrahydrofolate dehydrogenase/5,10-methenyltetrahydrofolate cyclohydrolase [Actinobacteria bacterium]|nr:bifunctional 5,10-methylenetetrahydrofolate dehydrogenase/5,10-methenyltetrahydrofolate cyclohydrolase [Actinomycetota bacterium]
MTATVLDGRAVAAGLKQELAGAAAEAGGEVAVAIVRGGGDEAAEVYARRLVSLCQEVGVGAREELLSPDARTSEAVALVDRLNRDPRATGILVQLPLPQGLDSSAVLGAVDPLKDLDGVSPANAGRLYLGLPALAPATPLAVMELLARYGVELSGRRAVVVGRSNITGKPIAMLLLRRDATVAICHSRTADLAGVAREADILVAAAGRPGIVTGDMVAPGATVVDVATNFVDGRMTGDVVFDAVAAVAGAVSPVPGGVGPLTNLMLVRNLLEAARMQEAARE